MRCTALPVFCIIKWLNLSFHLKSRKANGGSEAKALLEVEQSFEQNRNQEVPDILKFFAF